MNPVYFDLETTGLDPFTSRVTLAQYSRGSIITLCKPDRSSRQLQELKHLLKNSLVVGHNLKFDLKFLRHHFNIEPTHLFDTWTAEILISGGLKARQKGAATLEAVTRQHTGLQLQKDAALRQSFRGQELTQEQIHYAAMDVAVLPAIHKRQLLQLEELELMSVFETEMACIPATVWLELSGIPVDRDGLKKLALETRQKLEEAQFRVLTILKESGYRNLDLSGLPVVNLNSSVQLVKVLQAIGLDIESTGDRVISGLQHPVGQAIKEYRKQKKLLSTFLEKLPKHINPITGRIHADFNQQGTLAGRFSCRNPNLQQLPRDSNIRQLFRSNNGSTIITADYSQIELRILAEVSQEPKFIELFKNGGDLHKLTASLIFNKPLEQVTKEERYIAKSINFGLSYGMGAGGLQANLRENGIEIDKERAGEYIRAFFRSYPRVSEYLDRAGTFAVEHSYIMNKAGRIIRYRPAADERERAAIAREGKNNPIQSLNADITKLAMGRLYHRLKPFNARLINVVHDELVFEVPQEDAEEATGIIRDEMEAAGREYLTCVPVIVEINAGEAWEK